MRINVSAWSVALAEVFMCFSGALCAYGEPVKSVLCGIFSGLVIGIDYTWHEFKNGDKE